MDWMDSEPRSAAAPWRPLGVRIASATDAGGDLNARASDAGHVTRPALAALGGRSFGQDGLNGLDGLRTAKRCSPVAAAWRAYRERDGRRR